MYTVIGLIPYLFLPLGIMSCSVYIQFTSMIFIIRKWHWQCMHFNCSYRIAGFYREELIIA